MIPAFTLRKRVGFPFDQRVVQPIRRAMFACALGLATALPGPADARTVTIVTNDHGGSLESRLQTLAQLRAAGTRVEIRGHCASACTLLLGLPNACVARSSRLGFHGPQSQHYGVSLPPQDFEHWSQVMAAHYPGPIRDWFLAKARQTLLGVITISGTQAIKMGARPCA